jgi:aspartate/methionine/tyrosine aminotransferase
MNAPVQCALPDWLEGREEIQRQIRQRVACNLAELNRQLERAAEVNRLDVEGGWYAVLRIPALQPDEQTVLALLERGVWVQPGSFFGFRVGRVWLAGDKPARRAGGIQPWSNHSG